MYFILFDFILFLTLYKLYMYTYDLDISRQVRNLKKTTKLFSLKNMFRQKPLSSSVN